MEKSTTVPTKHTQTAELAKQLKALKPGRCLIVDTPTERNQILIGAQFLGIRIVTKKRNGKFEVMIMPQ